MAQFVLINPVGTRYAGEVLDTVQDGQDVITQLASFGGVLVPLPNALLEPYIARCEQLRVVGNNDEATAMMQAAYASSTAIAGGGTAGKVPLWTSASGLGDSAITQVAGSIASLSTLVGGTGYPATTFTTLALGGGTGSGATAQIGTSGGAVIWVALKNPGTGYTAGDVLTIPGGTGTVTVGSVVPKNDAAGHVTAQRIGAGTTQPNAGLDSRAGRYASGVQSYSREWYSGANATQDVVDLIEYVGAPGPNSLYGSLWNLLADMTGVSVSKAIVLSNAYFGVQNTSGSAFTSMTGHNVNVIRSYASDTNTNVGMTGASFGVTLRNANNYTTASMTAIAGSVGAFNNGSGTTAVSYGVRSSIFARAAGAIFTEHHGYDAASTLDSGGAITTLYGLRLRALTVTAPSVYPATHWSIAQDDPLAKSRFYGNIGVGNGLDVGAGKVIGSLTLTNGGTGYTNGTYSQVALTTVTGTGTGATADIVVAGGIVTTVVLRAPGQGYAVGNTLSCASIGAGANFLVTVATTASILRSDGTSVATRFGAGTTSPIAAMHAVGGTWLDGLLEAAVPASYSQSVGGLVLTRNWAWMRQGALTPTDMTAIGTGAAYGSALNPILSNLAGTYQGIQVFPSVFSSSGASAQVSGFTFRLLRTAPNDLATLNFSQAFSALQQAFTGAASAAAYNFGTVRAFSATLNFTAAGTTTSYTAFDASPTLGAAHAITTAYGLRLQAWSISGGATITNHWGISQEDSAANNVLAGRTAAGQAAGTAATAFVDVGSGGATNAQLRLRTTGGTAPSAPNDGDIWFDGTALRIRIGGLTRTVTVT
jgi:hypothetical protein